MWQLSLKRWTRLRTKLTNLGIGSWFMTSVKWTTTQLCNWRLRTELEVSKDLLKPDSILSKPLEFSVWSQYQTGLCLEKIMHLVRTQLTEFGCLEEETLLETRRISWMIFTSTKTQQTRGRKWKTWARHQSQDEDMSCFAITITLLCMEVRDLMEKYMEISGFMTSLKENGKWSWIQTTFTEHNIVIFQVSFQLPEHLWLEKLMIT